MGLLCGLLALALTLSGCDEGEARTESGPPPEPTVSRGAPDVPATSLGPAPPPPPAADPTRPAPAQAEQAQTASPVASLLNRGVDATLVQLIDPLDEPEFYCVDVPGFGASLNLTAALSAHTCKPGADDELFRSGTPLPGNLQMPAYDLCLEAATAEPAASLHLKDCSNSPLQLFSIDGNGALRLADTTLCLTIAPGAGEPTGGPSHLRRDLALADCGAAPANRRSWQLPGPSPA